MKSALLPGRKKYTVEEYVAEFGPKLDALARRRVRPTMVCMACTHPMHTVAEGGPIRDATWAHNPSINPPWCPLKDPASGKYTVLAPTVLDEAAGQALRAVFFKNWRLHWAHILEIIPMSNIFTLIEFIRYADGTKFWSQPGLREWFIPYIFLATCDFPPPKSSKGAATRPNWIRCRFDARVRNPQDLWIRTEGDWGFIRAEYITPARGAEPGPKHLIDVTIMTPDDGFLTRVSPGGNPYQLDKMQKAFLEELT